MVSSPQARRPSVTPRLEALVGCIRGDGPDVLAPLLAAAVKPEGDMTALAAHHGVASFVYLHLNQLGLQTEVPARQWARLQATHVAVTARWGATLDAGHKVLGLLDEAGIGHALPVKGLAYAALLGRQAVPRDISDIDLVVSTKEFTAAREALQEAGFEPDTRTLTGPVPFHHPPGLRGLGIYVELHETLWSDARLPGSAPLAEELLNRSVLGEVTGTGVRTVSPEDAVLIDAGMLARDRFNARLRRWAELYRLLTTPGIGLCAQRLLDLAAEQGLLGVLGPVVRFVGELFGDERLTEGDLSDLPVLPGGLRRVIRRRLLEGSTHQHTHAAVFDALSRRKGAGTVTNAATTPTGPLHQARRAGAYAARLCVSSSFRREFSEELTIRRSLEG